MKAKILIIEDNAENYYLMRYLLESFEYEVHGAETGLTGLKLAPELMPDCILLDIQLPEMDGYKSPAPCAPTGCWMISRSSQLPPMPCREIRNGLWPQALMPISKSPSIPNTLWETWSITLELLKKKGELYENSGS